MPPAQDAHDPRERLLRPPRTWLPEATKAARGARTGREAWRAIVLSGLLPSSALDHPRRWFLHHEAERPDGFVSRIARSKRLDGWMVTVWFAPDIHDPGRLLRGLPGEVISRSIREVVTPSRACSCEDDVDTMATLEIRAPLPFSLLDPVVFSPEGLRRARPALFRRWPATPDDALAFAASWGHARRAEELAVALAGERGLLRSALPRLRWRLLRTASEIAGFRVGLDRPQRWASLDARERELVGTGFLLDRVRRGHFVDLVGPPLAGVFPYVERGSEPG